MVFPGKDGYMAGKQGLYSTDREVRGGRNCENSSKCLQLRLESLCIEDSFE